MWSHIAVGCSISIHAPAKGATVIKPKSMPKKELFQSTLPRRERRSAFFIVKPREKFQSTLPRRERHPYRPKNYQDSEFQSTLPRRERLYMFCCAILIYIISIHAPAKGATANQGARRYKKEFQSTLPRRERLQHGCDNTYSVKFQSTLPRRERRVHLRRQVRFHTISIHAPAKGATLPGQFKKVPGEISIHAPAKGAT